MQRHIVMQPPTGNDDPLILNLIGNKITATERGRSRKRTWGRKLATEGLAWIRSFKFPTFLEAEDYYKLVAWYDWLDRNTSDRQPPYGECIIYNFLEPYPELRPTSEGRSRQIVPWDGGGANPHLLSAEVIGSDTRYLYYFVQQVEFEIGKDVEESGCLRYFTLDISEARVKTSDEES